MMYYCVDVTLNGTKVTYMEQNWLIGTFDKFLGLKINDIQSQMLAFSLYAKVKLFKTKQGLNEDDTFINIVRFLQAYKTDFQLQEVGKDLKKCYALFERLEKLEKEKKVLEVGSLEFDRNGLLVGLINNDDCTISPKFIDFDEEKLFNKRAQTTDNENDIF